LPAYQGDKILVPASRLPTNDLAPADVIIDSLGVQRETIMFFEKMADY